MGLAVVGGLAGGGGDGDLVLGVAVGDREGALALADGVVVGLGVGVQRVVERVVGGADQGLGAGHVVRGALARSPAIATFGHFAVLERRAVVFLLVAGGGQGDGALVNSEGTRLIADYVIARNIDSVRRSNGIRSDIFASLTSYRISNGCICITVEQPCDCALECRIFITVSLAAVFSLNGQRERVVNRDDVAVSGNRNGLARVVAVDREVLLLVRGDRSRRVLSANDLLRNHILGDLGRGALEIVMHGNRGFVEVEVDLQDG